VGFQSIQIQYIFAPFVLSLIAHELVQQIHLSFKSIHVELTEIQPILLRGSKTAENGKFASAPSVLLLAVKHLISTAQLSLRPIPGNIL
jgi:hypothetical protein